NSTGYSATSAADDRADLGTGFVIAGAALVVTGAIVYFTAPRDVAVVPSATGSSLGLAVAGRF
ncbi:MAG TPA: hypothetical protein VLX92_25760, partial [Kofleriaceae bacterium]|nr:hypothetical protein [Kofleriaceae bacterium]